MSLWSGDGVFGDEGLLVECGVAGGDDFAVGGGAGAEEEDWDEDEEQAGHFKMLDGEADFEFWIFDVGFNSKYKISPWFHGLCFVGFVF